MICFRCGLEYDSQAIGFKAVCSRCESWLHSCRQCSLFDSNASRCRSLTTESVKDREGLNYCEEFVPGNAPSEAGSKPSAEVTRESFNRLFGESD